MALGPNQKQLFQFYAVGLGLLALALNQAFQLQQGARLSFLDVGQGDAILIQTPEFHQILIDAGVGSKVVDELGKTMDFFDKEIDLFVLTHPDRDHFAGVLDVLQKYKINRILMTGVVSNDSMYREFLSQAKAEGIPIEFAESDRDYQIGTDLYLDVLYPPRENLLIGQSPSDKNNTSVALRLLQSKGGGMKPLALMAGDAEAPEEALILASGEDVRAEILKLGHHGSKSSTTETFLKAVNPSVAVVSAGLGNRYGHPAPETMEKVKNLEIRRTDKEGTVTITF